MSQTCSPSTQRRYGLARVCRLWELARSTVYLAQARQMATAILEPEMEPNRGVAGMGDPEVRTKVGSPGWARTSDFLINSRTQDLRTTMHDEPNPRDSEGW